MKSLANLFVAVVITASLAALAGAQKPEPVQPAQTPAPAAAPGPIYSAADLAALVPAPKPDDVKSLDAIMHAIYDVISGPAGDRDWNRFHSLCLPQVRLTAVGQRPDGSPYIASFSIDDYIHRAREHFAKEGFYENAIVNQTTGFGNMNQVLSSYESRHAPGEKPFQRGVNSFQLLNDGKRWWIVSILWDSERPDNPLPASLQKN
ncbi:MAG: hypothetical protein WAN03_09815 [Candidatus Sulfotelmatobacter sp.]